jgi:hypothetical protein
MKGSEAFKETIGNYIIANNIDIAKHPDKTLDGCIDYIFTTVQESGCNGFTDDEIFGMAVHYKEDLLESTNIDTSPDEMKVLDDFLFRCWQMGWLDKYEKGGEE